MSNDLEKRKKLLLIAPLFFGYYKEITAEAERMGYDVTYVCDAPSNSNISKALARINKELIRNSTKKYFDNIVIPKISEYSFDYVLLVAGMTFSFTPNEVEKMKKKCTGAKLIMYQWDSEDNLPYSTKIHQFFDEIYSFDRNDCNNKSFYKFLPLFYTRTFEKIGLEQTDIFEYDCSYIGTAHPKKYISINEMAVALKKVFPNQFIYHYMPSKLKYLYHKITAPEYKKAKFSDFKTEKIPMSEIMKIFKISKCILDSPQAGQNGLTVRTIECLGAKRKLVTTNEDIKNYDFYREENILVFDKNIDFNSAFFKKDYLDIPREIYQKYSLKSWLQTMLN